MAEPDKSGIRSLVVGFVAGFGGGVLAAVFTLQVLNQPTQLSELRPAPDEVVKVGETLRLRSESGRPVVQAYLSRPSLRVGDNCERTNLALVELEATSPGLTTLTLVDDQNAVTKVRILVEP